MPADLNRLRTFVLVHQHCSISQAAQICGITPSAVSQQLRKLEEELGASLFTRPHKKLIPTSVGESLFETVRPLILAVDRQVESLQRARETPHGLLKIGAPLEFGKVLLPQMIGRYRQRYPDVRFLLRFGRTSEMLPQLLEGKLDFALIDTFPTRDTKGTDWSGFALEPLVEENVVLACSFSFAERNLRHPLSFELLSSQPFIAQQPDARAIRNWFRHSFDRQAPELNIAVAAASHQAVVNCILEDIGLGIVVIQLTETLIDNAQIEVIRVGRPDSVNLVSLIQLQDKVPSLTERSFQKHMRQYLSASPANQPPLLPR